MSAVPYLTLDDVLENMEFQCEVSILLAPFAAVILAYRIANSGFLSAGLSQDDKNNVLKKLTGCVVETGTNLNCYPLGMTDTLCFDSDGNVVP